ncbi:MAG: hypothetical protein ACE5DI_03835 [Candidatus Micrarchaeia archaeon]
MLKEKRRRSQVSAPMELVIAVIIMSMSLAIAFYVWDSTACSRCLAEQKSESQKLQLAMQSIALGFSGTKAQVDYTMRSCCGQRIDGVRVSRYTSREFCKDCSSSYGGCWKIEPAGYDSEGNLVPFTDASVCVDMSESLEISQEACQPLDGKNAVDLDETPCPRDEQNSNTAKTNCKSYLVECGSGWWARTASNCNPTSTVKGEARFKTISRIHSSSKTSRSYSIALTKGTTAGGKIALLTCAYPRQ